jgi:hypothetical protein
LHSTRWTRRTFDFSSAWTTAVIAGVLGLGLTFLLFVLAPPPEAAVKTSTAATRPDGSTTADSGDPATVQSPSDLDLVLQRTHLPLAWNPNELASAESMTPAAPPPSQAFVLFPRDDWQAAAVRPALAQSVPAEPYYLRAPRADAALAATALEAADVPPGDLGPAPQRNLAVSVERISTTDGADGASQEYSLLVRNTAAEPVESVTVRDSMKHIEQVIDVVPPAAVAPDGTLVWRLENLGPGEEVRLTVTLQSAAGAIESMASVDVASAFGSSTRVAQLDRPPPFSPTPDKPELALPSPAVLNGNIAASGAIPFDDELPDAASAMPSRAELPGNDPGDTDLIIPESILPGAASLTRPAEAFEDELPASTAPPAETYPSDPSATTDSAVPEAEMPAVATPFDDAIPETSSSIPADSSRPESSTQAPFDPFSVHPAEPDPVTTTSSDSEAPANDAVLPLEGTSPRATTPTSEPDSTEEPDWAPRTLPADNWDSPPRPILSVKARSPNAVHRGEIVTAYYDITNTGNAPAEDVVLTVRLPDELLHKHGTIVEHRIERLEPGESRRARLLARARTAGTARLDATLSHRNHDDEQAAVSIRVVGQSAAPRR